MCQGLFLQSRGQNLVLTVLYEPCSLDSGQVMVRCARLILVRCMVLCEIGDAGLWLGVVGLGSGVWGLGFEM